MSYTLAMATDQEPKIAEDGVQDVPLTRARPLLTRLIEELREDGLVSALTVRGRRRVYLVAPDFYEQARRDRAVLELLRKRTEEATANEHPKVRDHAHVVGGWLADTEASIRS